MLLEMAHLLSGVLNGCNESKRKPRETDDGENHCVCSQGDNNTGSSINISITIQY